MIPSIFQALKSFWSHHYKPILFVGGGVLLVAVIFRACTGGSGEEEYTTEEVTRGAVEEIVRVTGQVQAKARFDLRFQGAGTLEAVEVMVGDRVQKGDILARLDAKDAELRIQEARAQVAFQQAQLDQLKAGSTVEARSVAKNDVSIASRAEELAQVQIGHLADNSEEDTARAKLNVQKAESAYTALLAEKRSLAKQVHEDVADAQLRLENARKAAADVTVKVGDVKATTEKDIEDMRENFILEMQASSIAMQDALDELDRLLGVSDNTSNDFIEAYFSVKSPQQRLQTETTYLVAEQSFGEITTRSTVLRSFDDEALIANERLLEIAVLNTMEALQATLKALEKSIVGSAFSEEMLDARKNTIVAQITTMDVTLQSVKSAEQAFQDALLQDTSQASIGGTEQRSQEYEVDFAAQNLEKVMSTGQLQLSQLETRVVDARENLEEAKQVLRQKKIEASTSVEEAKKVFTQRSAEREKAEARLKEVEADPRLVDLAPMIAELDKAEAALGRAQKDFDDMTLRAPASGIVTKIEAEVGEKISQDAIFMNIISEDREIVVDVSETDIARVDEAAFVRMTFDALPYTEVFDGVVRTIDPAETMIDGVTYYEVAVDLASEDIRIRPGMTANLDVVSGTGANVLLVPAVAIQYEDDGTYVDILEEEEVVRKKVMLGLEGEQYYEVRVGLQEGEAVITYRNN